jgi:hypothetical protein
MCLRHARRPSSVKVAWHGPYVPPPSSDPLAALFEDAVFEAEIVGAASLE